MDTRSRIYVAGHRGLAGSAIVRQLRSAGYTQVITRDHRDLDLTDAFATQAFFQSERPEYVFLAAAKAGGIAANDRAPAEFIYENLAIQTNVIHAAWRAGVQRLLFLGSSCIYPRDCPQPIREEYLLTGPLEATNRPYAIAKIAGIEMCWSYNRQYGTRFVCAMPTNLYGPGDRYDLQDSHVLPALMRKFYLATLASAGKYAAIERDVATHGPLSAEVRASIEGEGREVVLWGTGTPRREFLYSGDLARAAVMLMTSDAVPRFAGFSDSDSALSASPPLFNIGCGVDMTISELAELIRDVVGYRGEIHWDPTRPDGTPRKVLDVSRMRSLGWSPKITLREGVELAFEDYLARNEVAR